MDLFSNSMRTEIVNETFRNTGILFLKAIQAPGLIENQVRKFYPMLFITHGR